MSIKVNMILITLLLVQTTSSLTKEDIQTDRNVRNRRAIMVTLIHFQKTQETNRL